MKVCIVSLNIVPYYHTPSNAQYGGAEVQTAVLADAFAEAGAEVVLVVSGLGDGERLPHPALNAFDPRAGVPGTRFFHPRMTGITDALARADADVYFQKCAGMVTGLVARFAKTHGRPFVYVAGSDSDFSFRDVILGNLRDKVLFFWGLKNATGIVAQNAAQAALCRDRLGREARVIPNAIVPAESNPAAEDGSVVWIGGIRRVKRPDVFLELARRMPERRFVLIGGPIASEPETARDIERRARELPNLVMTGHVSHDEVDRYLERAALLVNTSQVEGFPNTFLEAWQRTTPVVSFVDVDDLIRRERVGVVCDDADAMAREVARLLDDAGARLGMGERARGLVERRYSAPVLAREHLDYFGELLGRVRVEGAA